MGTEIAQGISGALLVALAGFLYLHVSFLQRFQHAAATPQTRASLAIAYGLLFLFIVGFISNLTCWKASPLSAFLSRVWLEITPIKGLGGVFGAAPAAGLLAGLLSNFSRLIQRANKPYLNDKNHALFTSSLIKRMRLAALSEVAIRTDDQMLRTLWRAITLGKLVQVTMKSRKVYIGMPLPSRDPSVETSWLKVVPIASGFRDSETLAFIPTTDYRDLFDALAEDSQGHDAEPDRCATSTIQKNGASINFDHGDVGFLLPWSDVASLTIHDPELEAFFAPEAVEVESIGKAPEST